MFTFRGWGVEFFAQLLDSAVMTQLFYGLSASQLHHLSELFQRYPILGRSSVHHRHLDAGGVFPGNFFSSLWWTNKIRCFFCASRPTDPQINNNKRKGMGKRNAAPTPSTKFGQLSPMITMSLSIEKLFKKKQNKTTTKKNCFQFVKKQTNKQVKLNVKLFFCTYWCQPASPVRTEVHRWHAFTHAHSHTYAGRWRITSQPIDVRKMRKRTS